MNKLIFTTGHLCWYNSILRWKCLVLSIYVKNMFCVETFPSLLLQTCKDIFHQLVTSMYLLIGYQNRPTSLHTCMDEFYCFVTYNFVEWLLRQDHFSTRVHGYIPLFGDIQISVEWLLNRPTSLHICMNVFQCWVTFTFLWKGYQDKQA